MARRCVDCDDQLADGPAVVEHYKATGHAGSVPHFPRDPDPAPDRPDPAPPAFRRPSLVAGALDRSVVDAAAGYSARLAALWADQLDGPTRFDRADRSP